MKNDILTKVAKAQNGLNKGLIQDIGALIRNAYPSVGARQANSAGACVVEEVAWHGPVKQEKMVLDVVKRLGYTKEQYFNEATPGNAEAAD
jgi:hypothetical protein